MCAQVLRMRVVGKFAGHEIAEVWLCQKFQFGKLYVVLPAVELYIQCWPTHVKDDINYTAVIPTL